MDASCPCHDTKSTIWIKVGKRKLFICTIKVWRHFQPYITNFTAVNFGYSLNLEFRVSPARNGFWVASVSAAQWCWAFKQWWAKTNNAKLSPGEPATAARGANELSFVNPTLPSSFQHQLKTTYGSSHNTNSTSHRTQHSPAR